MQENIAERIKSNQNGEFEKIFVKFPFTGIRSVNDLIGRSAHISLIQDAHFIQLFQLACSWHC